MSDSNSAVSEETLEYLEKQIDLHTAQLLHANQLLQQEISERKRAELITRTLFRISNAVNTTKDLSELYSTLHQILSDIINLSNFYIAIYNKHLKKVSFPYFVDQYDSDVAYADQINVGNSLTGEVLSSRKAIFLDKADLQQRKVEGRIIGTTPNCWLGVPLTIEGEVIGIIAAQSYDEPHNFDALDLEVLISVSDHIALAIERKRNEQTIISNVKRYRNIINSIEDGYYEIDLQGNLLLVNQAMCKILGYDEENLLGVEGIRSIGEEAVTSIREAFTAILDKDLNREILELTFHSAHQGVRYVETVVSVIRDEENRAKGYRGIARDITERKAAEQFHQAQIEQLHQSQRLESLGTLAGGIAHDFNNLLMGIQGRTALMLNNLSTEHPHYSQLKNIEEYVESAASLTTRLLGFARGGKYEVQAVDINSLVDKTLQLFGRTRKEITITTDLAINLAPVEVDATQIEQVLLNLLLNASQAMIGGGGKITIISSQIVLDRSTASFHDIVPGTYVQLVLADTGKGMDTETMAKIFDPFFTTKEFGHGSGLGLAMVYGIVRNHAGTIAVESSPGNGAVFTLLLPVSEKKIAETKKPTLTMEKGTETILLVDDEPIILEVGEAILEALGYSVLTASSGLDAINIYREHQNRIDLFIVDMIMPIMSGGELFDQLKEMNPTVKVLLSSGYSIDGQAGEILDRGCLGFIQKPFSISQLSVKLRQILG